ncbi:NPC intracellular cholesterol transporter 1-like [Saccostrea cucullata]|uniref:NPC intracellular cholesterol transporter 1-like n=1 Tax=Saccostrea cuccullata TaxID=36930 RepID=UPI002ED0F891
MLAYFQFLVICLCGTGVAITKAESGQCIWYGQCGETTAGKQNCLYQGPSKVMEDPEGMKILKTYCPDLVTGNQTETCCDVAQLRTLQSNMGLPQQFFLRCPSCYNNFLNLYCYLTCGPSQSDFLRINGTVDGNNGTYVKAVAYYLTNEYAQGMYNSCKDVQMPSANEKALSIFCGRPAAQCTAQSWLTYMGSTANGHTPFGINFVIGDNNVTVADNSTHNSTYVPMNYTITPCNMQYKNRSACSCQDCETSCAPVPPIPPQPKPCTILHIDCYYFVFAIIFLAFNLFFYIYVICYNVLVRNSLGVMDTYSRLDSDDEDYTGAFCVNGDKKKRARYGSQDQMSNLPKVSHADINCLEKIGSWTECKLESFFRAWGTFCARHPILIIVLGLAIAGALSAGIAVFRVTTDPVKLWSAKDSRARTERDYFDSHFGPFYRTEQVIITRPHNKTVVTHKLPPPSEEVVNYTSLFDKEFLHLVLDLQLAIENITAEYNGEKVTLEDICFQPLSPDNTKCTIQSILQYFQNNHTEIDKVKMDEYGFFVLADYLDHLRYCLQAPASTQDTVGLNISCLAESDQPIFPWIALGGFDGDNHNSSEAIVITFIVNNHLDEEKNKKAEAWEKAFIEHMKAFSSPDMTVSYSSERSIEDEINRESNSDVLTILASYLIMFGYIAITLGQYRDCVDFSIPKLMMDAKITLGLAGVVIVLLSVSSSLGMFSYCGVAATLIIIEVVPFLVLAVGVDNIFILVQTFQRDKRRPNESIEEQIGRILGQVGPSMMLSSFSESIAFFLGALTNMPAVRVFSLYAAQAVLFDFLLQITVFIALMTLDAKRQKDNRFDMCCFIKVSNQKSLDGNSGGCLYKIVKDYYSHFLLKEWVRPIVITIFTFYFCLSGAVIHKLGIGLDQKLSMPDDSYVLDYFKNLSAYLHTGAPVYFVVEEGLDYKSLSGQNAICGGNGCPQDSLVGQLFTASGQPSYTKIAQPTSSWLDDYLSWLSPGGDPPCCRENSKTHGFCPSMDNSSTCIGCPMGKSIHGRPNKVDFMKYLPWFLKDNPGTKCAKGGHAAYGSGVNLIKNKTDVGATYFMTYHTIMTENEDYISGLKMARKIGDNITNTLRTMLKNDKITVFPYSVWYVFYEQYLSIVKDTIENLCICIGAIFVVTFLLLGFDFFSALMILITIGMIVVNILGFMYLWDITLNAVSLVNLVMAIGISVEFCAHITRAFAVSLQPTRVERARDSLAHMGSSVLSGITLTKLGGIIVLAFSKSQLFQVFYFRMYLAMVVYGATHGLIFLPVMLSYIGPPLNKAKLYKHQNKIEHETNGITVNRNNQSNYESITS